MKALGRVKAMAKGVTPNPSNRLAGKKYSGPAQFTGNFGASTKLLRIRTVNEDPVKGA